MSAYPDGIFVSEFARRTAGNLRDIKAKRPLSFQDTALVSALLAVFVLPYERITDDHFMADLLSSYTAHPIDRIVKVLRRVPASLEKDDLSIPKTVSDIPKFLRHSIAHLNIKPQSADGLNLTHILVWNVNPHSRKTTFVAAVHLGRLRSLALHVLDQLSRQASAAKYDGIDPIGQFDSDYPQLLPGNQDSSWLADLMAD